MSNQKARVKYNFIRLEQIEPTRNEYKRNKTFMSKPIAHYSASYRAGDLLFVSGQLGVKDGELVEGVEAQTIQALVNMSAVLTEHGATLENLAKCTVFMTDIGNFSVINSAYAKAFRDHRPARSAIAVRALPLGGLVEIEGFAHLGSA